jgi:hypothetical protein
MESVSDEYRTELSYHSPNGHIWMLDYPRRDVKGAVEAIFRWWYGIEEFQAAELGAFLSAILGEATEQGILTEESFRVVERIICQIPKTDLSREQQANMIRVITLAAVDSTA